MSVKNKKKIAVWIIVFISMIRFNIQTRIIPFFNGKKRRQRIGRMELLSINWCERSIIISILKQINWQPQHREREREVRWRRMKYWVEFTSKTSLRAAFQEMFERKLVSFEVRGRNLQCTTSNYVRIKIHKFWSHVKFLKRVRRAFFSQRLILARSFFRTIFTISLCRY